ncbi:MAG: ABC transporter ATP-binding protein, partial [Thiomicrospira sp.]|nr:ABC transporter ATP-binding protein [Thiomicrospira sp.]
SDLGYDDWLRQRPIPQANKTDSTPTSAPKDTPTKKPSKKLSYKDQREYDQLPTLIETLEQALEHLHQRIAASDFYQQPADQVQATLQQLNEKEQQLEHAFERWETLEAQLEN